MIFVRKMIIGRDEIPAEHMRELIKHSNDRGYCVEETTEAVIITRTENWGVKVEVEQ